MRARRVGTLHLLGHTVQLGFQVRASGPGRLEPRRWRWRVADWVNDHSPRPQCWSDLVSWVLSSGVEGVPLRDLRPRDILPWRPVTETCRQDAARTGCCYCGKVATAECAAMPNGPRAQVIVAAEPAVGR